LARIDPVFITRTIEATPFPSAPNVVASFPHREDWWNRYPALRRADSRNRNINEFEWLYQEQRRRHQDSVLKRLRNIQHSATGRAVLAELRARRSYSVFIFPWDFLPSIDSGDPGDLGAADPLLIPQTRRERARGIKPLGTNFIMRGVSFANMDKPGAVDVFYSDFRCEENEADGVLLHELVHAMRVISGVFHQSTMGWGYRDSEEFYANTIQMIYRSERGQAIHDYAYHPIDQATVLKRPQARALITALCHKQMSLCIALAQVDTPFNPIRAIAEKLFRIDV
jgi:hypothetical protein